MTILPVGSYVMSTRDPKLRGMIVGYGTLECAGPDHLVELDELTPTFVYLVWPDGMQGSSSLGPTVRVFDVHKTVEIIR